MRCTEKKKENRRSFSGLKDFRYFFLIWFFSYQHFGIVGRFSELFFSFFSSNFWSKDIFLKLTVLLLPLSPKCSKRDLQKDSFFGFQFLSKMISTILLYNETSENLADNLLTCHYFFLKLMKNC